MFSIPGHVGLGLNQAFYFGLPVVTEDGGQPPEINYLVDGRNGFIVPSDDLAELKNKIMFLIENDEVRRRFGENARRDILEHASVDNMFRGFRSCLDSLRCIQFRFPFQIVSSFGRSRRQSRESEACGLR